MTIQGAGDPPDDIEPPVTEVPEPICEYGPEDEEEREELSLEDQLQVLLTEHRQLDEHIGDLQAYVYQDQLELQRLKKKKLHLKDSISYIKDQIIPDWNA
jgi:hypothetical protein